MLGRSFISIEIMMEHKELIKRTVIEFGQRLQHLNPDEASIEQFNEVVNDTIGELELDLHDAQIAQAFFDTYIGLLQTNREAATEFVRSFLQEAH